MSDDRVNVTVDGAVVRIEIDRADKRNAIDQALAEALRDAVAEHGYRSDVRAIVIGGAGGHFCAGFDVATEDRNDDKSVRERYLGALAVKNAIEAIAAAPVVKIARLEGHVVGAGLLLALACELRYADASARFFIPELNMGLPFSLGGVTQLARYVGLTRAMDMVLNCTPVQADHPDARGLVTELVERGGLARRVDEVAASVAARPATLLMATLNTMREAGERLIPSPAVDVFTMLAVQDDPEARAVRRRYAERFKPAK